MTKKIKYCQRFFFFNCTVTSCLGEVHPSNSRGSAGSLRVADLWRGKEGRSLITKREGILLEFPGMVVEGHVRVCSTTWGVGGEGELSTNISYT